MSYSEKIQIKMEQETIDNIIKGYLTQNMHNESIMIYQEALLDKKTIEESLMAAVLNEGIILALESSLE
jgi:hypothetical protein